MYVLAPPPPPPHSIVAAHRINVPGNPSKAPESLNSPLCRRCSSTPFNPHIAHGPPALAKPSGLPLLCVSTRIQGTQLVLAARAQVRESTASR
jgi:hypothetical protein